MAGTVQDLAAAERTARLASINEARVIPSLWRLDPRPLQDVVLFERARGIRLWDTLGREWMDAFAGSQHVALGFGRPEITAAVRDSLEELSAGNLFHGRSHPRVVELAEALAAVTPAGIERFCFSVTGADAIESAITLVRHANAVQGRPEKHHIIGRRLSYHGLNYGARSATGQPGAHEGYGPLLPGFSHISYPTPDRPGAAAELEQRILELGPENVAAFVAEPVSFPSGGVVPPADYWPRIREICTKYDVLLIVDEVATGFGRTGEMFAITTWGVAPDVVTMAKAINNGAIPMGVVGITQQVYEWLLAPGEMLWHGFTGAANPAACAAALATLKIFEDEAIIDTSRGLSDHLRAELAALTRCDAVRGVRVKGLLCGIDFVEVPDGKTAAEVTRAAAAAIDERRVLVRDYPAVGTIIFSPAATATEAEISEMVARVGEAVDGLDL